MRLAALALTMVLAACGGGTRTSGTSDSASQNVATSTAECANKPDFAPVYGDAKISVCTASGTAGGQQSGTIVYTSAAAPKTVLGWSREQANASGLGQRMLTETMYSAGESTERSVMILVEPEGSGSRVTVNWGRL